MPRVESGRVRNAGAIHDALQAEKRAVPVGIKASAEPIQAYLEAKVSIPYPPPSAPGMPAHQRSGKYRRAWKVTPKNTTLTISNNVKYAWFLEGGTKFMKARPALTQNKDGGGAAHRPGGDGPVRKLMRQAGRSAADTARRQPLRRGDG
jgi:hypothetical protein